MPIVEGLSLFELRGLAAVGGPLAVEDWLKLALTVTDLAAEATDDDRLREP